MATNTLQGTSAREGDSQNIWYHLVWLDKNMNNFGTQIKVKSLREIDPDIETFVNEKACIDFIRQRNDRQLNTHIIFIISGALSESVIPQIQDNTCVFAIFIFCTHSASYEHLRFPKLRAIHTDIDELMDNIEMCITKFNETTDFSVFVDQQSPHSTPVSSEDKSVVQCSIRNLKEDLASFLWFRQMHEFMLTLANNNDREAKEEMLTNCREQYKGKSKMQLRIKDFNDQSLPENKDKAIRWYTENSFIHRCTNTVLRKENIAQVYSFRYIIKLICSQLKELHRAFIEDYQKRKKERLQVYRGQYLKADQIELLKNHTGNLISLNGFISTTKDRDIALDFIRNCWQKDFEPVLIRIDLDMTSEHSVPFADVSQFSRYPEEKEVLLSIGSVFCVKSVKLTDFGDQLELHVIHLSLKQNNQLTVIKYIEQTYARNADSADQLVLFGKLLFDMGACEAAVKYFSDALSRLTDDNNRFRPIFLNNLGVCHNEMGNKDEALKFYQRARAIYEQTSNQRGLSACQHNIASIYHAKGEQHEALKWASEALVIRRNNNLDKASTLDLLGCIHLASSDFDAALDNFEEALQLRLKYLGKIDPNHPDIGVSHHNLGKANSRIAKYTDAQIHYAKAAEIYRHNYPQSHPLVTEITRHLKKTR